MGDDAGDLAGLALRILLCFETEGIGYAATCDKSGHWCPEGRDIDIFAERKDLGRLERIVRNEYSIAGWKFAQRIVNDYSVQLYFFRANSRGGLEMSQWDLMPGATWRGIPYFKAGDLILHRVRNPEGVCCIDSDSHLLYKAARQLLWNGWIPVDARSASAVDRSYGGWIGRFARAFEDSRADGSGAVGGGGPAAWRRDLVLMTLKQDAFGLVLAVLRHFTLLFARFRRFPGLYLGIVGANAADSERIVAELKAFFVSGGPSLFTAVMSDADLSLRRRLRLLFDGALVVSISNRGTTQECGPRFIGPRFVKAILGMPETRMRCEEVAPLAICEWLAFRR